MQKEKIQMKVGKRKQKSFVRSSAKTLLLGMIMAVAMFAGLEKKP